MNLQNWEEKSAKIRQSYLAAKKADPGKFEAPLNLSWSNWGFGAESFATSVKRLADNGIEYIELHGNRYGADLGYGAKEVKKVLDDHGVKATGICGMFGPDNDLASNRGVVRQRAIDYLRRNVDLGHEMGVAYFLIVPAAVGRPAAIDDMEFQRSVDTLGTVADLFIEANIRGAIEPIRAAEVSMCHTFADAEAYIRALDAPGVQHINGDVYHMMAGECHIGETLVDFGARLTNLHLADTNRRALGDGSLDLDTIIMALYLIGFNNERCYCTPEPLGPGGDPYPAMFGNPDSAVLDQLVADSVRTWKEREAYVRSL